MSYLKRIPLLVILLIIGIIFISNIFVFADTDAQSQELQKKIDEYTQKIAELQAQKNTLSSQIRYMDTQIALAILQMQKTENAIIKIKEEIENISDKIDGLNTSIDYLTKIIVRKIAEGYKSRTASFFDFFLNTNNLPSFVNRIKYLKVTQDNDRRVAFQAQQAKLNFEEQKNIREKKQKELEALTIKLNQQKITFNIQKSAKQQLLESTNNDEKTYQDLLAKARAEFAAIQGIIAGKGTEIKLREVAKGEVIASVISGRSCNSSGPHLHFIAQENNNTVDPFQYLRPVDYSNCSGSSCGSGDGDVFNPSGSLNWPLSSPIVMNQGYGTTWAVRNTWVGRIYNFHNGIDIKGSSDRVFAVADGTLYRGSFSVSCSLHYVKLVHKDSNISTLYLHVYALES